MNQTFLWDFISVAKLYSTVFCYLVLRSWRLHYSTVYVCLFAGDCPVYPKHWGHSQQGSAWGDRCGYRVSWLEHPFVPTYSRWLFWERRLCGSYYHNNSLQCYHYHRPWWQGAEERRRAHVPSASECVCVDADEKVVVEMNFSNVSLYMYFESES